MEIGLILFNIIVIGITAFFCLRTGYKYAYGQIVESVEAKRPILIACSEDRVVKLTGKVMNRDQAKKEIAKILSEHGFGNDKD